jgi:CBS domain containing-hemolysin-like protein
MQRTGVSRLLVTDGDHLLGIVSLKDLLRFLNLKLELQEQGDGPATDWPPSESRQHDVPVHH